MKIQTTYGDVHVLTNCPLLDSTDVIEFLTNVDTADDGTEHRSIARPLPRQVLTFNYVAMRQAMADLFHMQSANIRKLWGVPLVHLKQTITDVENADFIETDTSYNQVDFTDYVLIRGATDTVAKIVGIGRYIVTQQAVIDAETQEIIEPEIVEYQDGYRLDRNITAQNAFVMPLKICIVAGDIEGAVWFNGQRSTMNFAVLAQDGPNPVDDIPTQYKGYDFYSRPLLMDGGSLEMRLFQQQTLVDNQVGQFHAFTDHERAMYAKPLRCVLKSQAEHIAFRKFLMRRMGRFRAFWLPLYENHLNIVSAGLLANWFEVDTKYVIETNRKHIAVKIAGVWRAHEITNKVINAGITRLTVSPSLNVQREQIEAVCYLALHRLDADRIEFAFLGAGKSTTTILITEVEQ